MITKELHIKNRTLGIGFRAEFKNAQKLYTFQLYKKTDAKQIGQDAKETYFTIAMLFYAQRIKFLSHKRTHIKERIA